MSAQVSDIHTNTSIVRSRPLSSSIMKIIANSVRPMEIKCAFFIAEFRATDTQRTGISCTKWHAHKSRRTQKKISGKRKPGQAVRFEVVRRRSRHSLCWSRKASSQMISLSVCLSLCPVFFILRISGEQNHWPLTAASDMNVCMCTCVWMYVCLSASRLPPLTPLHRKTCSCN